eukprot:gnl/Hemi2/1149_TR410_c0_g1_i2.p1 gnl/Hemi2/1149_TR410_c0_g1~~gnl/Hemi2/1149_TR410_c0_g1_i2.p1  ORF type:complete len:119 (+),score=33.06 gnl/Hemi2/1149_TR410_c0_g1_i2:392-748(+)
MSRFRPNIVVTNCRAWEEEEWDVVEIGGVRFHMLKKCTRCKVTTTNQDTAAVSRKEEPLVTLRQHHYAPPNGGSKFNQAIFGVNASHEWDATTTSRRTLRLGLPLTVLSTNNKPWHEI